MLFIKYFKVLFFIFLVILFGACKKFVQVEPPTSSITEKNVFDNDLTAAAVLTGIYSNLSSYYLNNSILPISKLAGLSADEFDLWSGAPLNEQAYYQNSLVTSAGGANGGLSAGIEVWNTSYPYIYQCNQTITGLNESKQLTPSVKQQLLGEAKFLRAFFYFYLVNLYGDVPIVTDTYFDVNRKLARAATDDVYKFIISDLRDAESLLSSSFLGSDIKNVTTERVRPTKWAASALLARCYLYTNDNLNAENEATGIINQSTLFDVLSVPLNKVFLKNSKEAIWQIQPTTLGLNTTDAQWFVLSDNPAGFGIPKTVYLSSSLYNAFEVGDARKLNWVGAYSSGTGTYYFPYKYKKATQDPNITTVGNLTEYEMVLRLAEQYLIRAEARAKQSNLSGAVSDLNVIRQRAGLAPLLNTTSQSQILAAIEQENRVEFFSEWGHRWLDLIRWGRADVVLAPVKGTNWQTTDKLYPIPIDDILRDHNLSQNPGY